MEAARAVTTTHGQSRTTEYRIWLQMRARCGNPNHANYARYGGRGIKVCQRWENSFEAFLEDMGPRPSSNHSLDRVNNNKGYGPDNCAWALPSEQANNRRTNSNLTFEGRTQTIAQWAAELGISQHTLRRRLEEGWSVAVALTTRARKTGKRLSKDQLVELKELAAQGLSNAEIARRLGVSPSAVSYRLKH